MECTQKILPDSVILFNMIMWKQKKRENGLECDLMVLSAANVSIFRSELHLDHPRGVHHLSVFSGQWPFTMKAPVPSIRKKNTSSDQIKAQQMLGDICLHPKKANKSDSLQLLQMTQLPLPFMGQKSKIDPTWNVRSKFPPWQLFKRL